MKAKTAGWKALLALTAGVTTGVAGAAQAQSGGNGNGNGGAGGGNAHGAATAAPTAGGHNTSAPGSTRQGFHFKHQKKAELTTTQ